MVMQPSHHVVDCPSCDRPIEIKSNLLGRETVCSHCSNRFVIYQSTDQETIAAAICDHLSSDPTGRILLNPNCTTRESLTLILVEHRDEVFARVAADVKQFGMVVVRAESVAEAQILVNQCDSPLVVTNRDLPGQNGWVLADELNRIDSSIEVWLYMPQSAKFSEVLAKFLNVSGLLEYEGDIFSLSDAITQRLTHQREQSRITEDAA